MSEAVAHAPVRGAGTSRALFFALLAGALALALLAGIGLGAAGFRAGALADLLAGDEIVAGLRGPRVAAGALAGAALALAGVSMQTVLRNDLADPFLLGIAGGASAGAVLSLAFFPGLPPGPAAALGAAGAAVLVQALAGPARHDPARLVLAGVATGSVLTSFTGLVLVLAPAERLLRSTTFWLFGGLATPSAGALLAALVGLALALGFLFGAGERMDRLLLGADAATSLGVDVRRLRRALLALAVLLTAGAVAAGGLIGFVGLVAPHVARGLFGARHRLVVPAAALFGATLLSAADTVARTAFAPREIPVGLLTAALGGPFFLWLLRRRVAWL